MEGKDRHGQQEVIRERERMGANRKKQTTSDEGKEETQLLTFNPSSTSLSNTFLGFFFFFFWLMKFKSSRSSDGSNEDKTNSA